MDVHHCFATTSGSTMMVNNTGLCGWFRPIHAGIGAKKRSNMASNSYFISLLVWFMFLWVSDFLYIAWLECWSLFTNYHPCLSIFVKPVETATNHGFPNAALCSSDETGYIYIYIYCHFWYLWRCKTELHISSGKPSAINIRFVPGSQTATYPDSLSSLVPHLRH